MPVVISRGKFVLCSCIYCLLFLGQLCCRLNKPGIIRVLVEEGKADTQEAIFPSRTVALHEAASSGHMDCVKVSVMQLLWYDGWFVLLSRHRLQICSDGGTTSK